MITEIISTIEDDNQREMLNQLYKENEQAFLKTALYILGKDTEAQDAVQEAFLKITDNPDNLFSDAVKNKAAYINAIIRNVSIKMRRMQDKKLKIEVELADDLENGEPDLEDKIISSLSVDLILDFIDKLPETMKEALDYKIRFKMTYAMIAQELGITEDAVKKRISRAAKLIRQFMEDSNNE